MSDGIKTALRTLRLFQLYSKLKTPLVLSELARHLEMPVSSCHALVATLLERGYLYELNRREGYYPSARMLHHVNEIAAHDPVTRRMVDALTALRDRTGETVILAQRQDTRAIYLHVYESPHTVRFTSIAGDLRPLHGAAAGKALLDTLPPAEQKALIRHTGMPSLTDKTITSFEELQLELARSRKRGWYTSVGETVKDAMAVAMPLRIDAGQFAVSIVGPASRMKADLAKHVEALRETCDALQSDTSLQAGPGLTRTSDT